MKYLLLVIIFIFSSEIIAQEFTISGKVVNEQDEPVAFANVLILDENETIINGTSSLETGSFSIKNLVLKNYTLKISFIGFKDFNESFSLSENKNFGIIILKEETQTLEGVTIKAKKPTIKKLADRLVFNVEGTALSEGNILDVLRNTPTVLIFDQTIKIKKLTPTIYINDRKVNLSVADIIQLLESTPANSIKSIEAITAPGAKYDASGGVVLNIVMGKNLITGYNGRVFGSYKQGVFSSYNGGISNFYKTKKISLSANYSYSKNKINRDNDDRINYLNADNALNQIWESKLNRNTKLELHNINTSLDYFINDNNTVTLSSNISLTPYFKYSTKNKTIVFNNQEDLQSSFNANTLSRDNKNNLGIDVDYVSKFKNNSKLSLNTHYTSYDYSRGQNVNSQYFLADNTFDFNTAFRTNSNQKINITTSQVDYYKPLKKESSLSFGVKNSVVYTNSDLTQFDIVENQDVLNTSNIFDYKENVFASYFSYEDKIGDFSFTTGLRVEQTNIEGESFNSLNTQSYLEWFPTVILNHQTFKNAKLYATYKRSISRPNYQSLNPFEYFLNDNVIVSGNPNLQPSFSNKWDFGTIINNKHQAYVTLTTTNGNINELPRQNNTTNIITYTPENIGKTTILGFSYETDFTLLDKLNFYFGTEVYNATEKTVIENQSIKLNQWSNYTYLIGSANFLKDESLSTFISLTYSSKDLQGLKRVKGRLYSDLSISKTILNKKGAISLVASDLFNAADYNVSTNYLNQRNSQFTDLDNRYIKLGFSYKFGNSTLESNEKEKQNKERDRIKNSD